MVVDLIYSLVIDLWRITIKKQHRDAKKQLKKQTNLCEYEKCDRRGDDCRQKKAKKKNAEFKLRQSNKKLLAKFIL